MTYLELKKRIKKQVKSLQFLYDRSDAKWVLQKSKSRFGSQYTSKFDYTICDRNTGMPFMLDDGEVKIEVIKKMLENNCDILDSSNFD